jgi:hypothetical protein
LPAARRCTVAERLPGVFLRDDLAIFSFTLSADTSDPCPPRRLDVKKYLSSNVPCGVCTYLPAVARLTVDSCIPMSFATSFSTSGRRKATPRSRNSCWNFTMLDVTM